MNIFKKLKAWATDGPSEPSVSLVDIFLPKGPTLSATESIKQSGFPYVIYWKSLPVREDN